MIELVFVIVALGIIGKFGVEFLAQAYNNYVYSSINNQLQAQSAVALEAITARLQHRIKESAIAKKSDDTFLPLSQASGEEYTILEWIGRDVESFRGSSTDPLWSGMIDLDASVLLGSNRLVSPESNTTSINSMIDTLSNGTASLSNAVLFFLGSEIDVTNGFGWSGALVDQTQTLHPIQAGINANEFSSSNADDFSGIDVYEFYQLAWSAYALAYENGSLFLYYNYQPWEGETYKDGSKELMMERVSTFRFMAIGDIIKIQLCVKSELTSEEYSICKEKTVF